MFENPKNIESLHLVEWTPWMYADSIF